MARRCAETFVRENGYTDELAEDSTRWVREWEDGGPWPRVLAARIGMLAPNASTAQCSMRECIVLFRVRRPVLLCAYRAVTMTQVFTRLRLVQGGIRDVRCRAVVASSDLPSAARDLLTLVRTVASVRYRGEGPSLRSG